MSQSEARGRGPGWARQVWLPHVLRAAAVGMDTIQLGIMMIVNLSIGLYHPPIGTTLFITSSLARVKVGQTVRELGPFYVVAFGVLALWPGPSGLYDLLAAPLVAHFSRHRKLSADDVAELRRLVAALDDQGDDGETEADDGRA